MLHELKIHPTHYHRVVEGTKTFEIRDNDRAFQRGDTVIMSAFQPDKNISGMGYYLKQHSPVEFPDITAKIGDVYPIDDERVVFSLLDVKTNIVNGEIVGGEDNG